MAVWKDDSPLPPYPGWCVDDPPPKAVRERLRMQCELAVLRRGERMCDALAAGTDGREA